MTVFEIGTRMYNNILRTALKKNAHITRCHTRTCEQRQDWMKYYQLFAQPIRQWSPKSTV